MTKKLWYLVYIVIRNIPSRDIPFFRLGMALRRVTAKRFLSYVGFNVNIETGCCFYEYGKGVKIGDHSGCGIRASIGPYTEIGADVMMGPDVVIITQNHRHNDTMQPMIAQGYDDIRGVVIEDDVWIGQRVIILPGVHIGRSSIIGAGAVVSKNVPQYSIVCGNPARVVKSRLQDV